MVKQWRTPLGRSLPCPRQSEPWGGADVGDVCTVRRSRPPRWNPPTGRGLAAAWRAQATAREGKARGGAPLPSAPQPIRESKAPQRVAPVRPSRLAPRPQRPWRERAPSSCPRQDAPGG
eukprot:scaffold571_cov364-Prasinococcus_capsulatus_cf.AAC.1